MPRATPTTILVLCLAVPALAAAQEILWSRTYGAGGAQTANDADATPDGGYVLFGYTEPAFDDFLLIKTDAEGNLEWDRTWGGTYTDWGQSVRAVPGGGYVVAGMWGTSPERHDAYMARLDELGNVVWHWRYGTDADERAHSVSPTADGGFVLVGQQRVGGFPFDSYDILLIKTDSQGNVEWFQLYAKEESGNDVGLSVQETAGGGYVIGGSTQSSTWACWALRTDALGELLWDRTFGGGSAGGNCADTRQTADGGFIFTGCATPQGDCDLMLVRTDGDGNPLWQQNLGDPNTDDAGHSVREMPDGGFAIAGVTSITGSWDVNVVRTDANGDELWRTRFGDESDDRGGALVPVPGGFAVAGWFAAPGGDWLDALLFKIGEPAIFDDGFESGDTSAWSEQAP